jgi:hypothetical protein
MSTQRRRTNRSIITKINSIDSKVDDARSAQKAPAQGSVTPEAFVPGAVGPEALRTNAVTNDAVAPGAIATENLGTVNAVNSDSTLVLGASVGVALGGDAYTTRPISAVYLPRKSTPSYNVTMGPTGTLQTGNGSSNENFKLGWVDPDYSGGLVGIYWEQPGSLWRYVYDSTTGQNTGYADALPSRSPDIYAMFVPGYEPQPSDQVLLVHDTSTQSLGSFSGTLGGPGDTVTNNDSWVILNKFAPMPKQLRLHSLQTLGSSGDFSVFNKLTTFDTPTWTHTIANITAFSGLTAILQAVPAGSLIGGVPPQYAPDYRMDFRVLTSTEDTVVQVYPDGTVRNKEALTTTMGWIEFNSIKFPAKGTPWVTDGVTMSSGFDDAGGTSAGPVRYWVDPYGFCWWGGIVRMNTANTTDGKVMFSGPAVTNTHNGSQYHLQAADYGANGFALTSQYNTNGTWKTGSPTTSGSTISLAQHCYPTPTASNPQNVASQYWGTGNGADLTLGPASDRVTTLDYTNNWVSRSSNGANGGTTIPTVWGRPDGIVWLQGFLASGTVGSAAFANKAWYQPSGRMVTGAVATNASARVDINVGNVTPFTGSNNWFSLDSISYIPQNYKGY